MCCSHLRRMDFTGNPVSYHHNTAEDWSLFSHILQTRVMHETHSGSNVEELLHDVVSEWDITEKDLALVSDNAAHMVVTVHL